MTYEKMRRLAESGDLLLVRGNRAVRILSSESFSHIAVLVWMPANDDPKGGGLWVFEFVEGAGFQSMPASQWFNQRQGQKVFCGEAPPIVASNPATVFAASTSYRDATPARRRYGWLSLVTVWVSQILRRRLPVHGKVCSTYAQEIWEATGYDGFKLTADPGNFVDHCRTIVPVEYEEVPPCGC